MPDFWTSWLIDRASLYQGAFASGNQVELLVDAENFIPVMIDMIQTAEYSIGYQFYGIEADEGGLPFAHALMNAKQRSLDVKIILDWVDLFLRTNTKWTFHPFASLENKRERLETRALVYQMEQLGIDVLKYGWRHHFRRNHSKMLIKDLSMACVGGFNPTGHNREWHEVCALVKGPIVKAIHHEFNWLFRRYNRPGLSHGLELPAPVPQNGGLDVAIFSNHSIDGHHGLTRFLFDALSTAKESIWIENGYLAHRDVLLHLLAAKKRGVTDINIITPEKSNHKTVYARFHRWVPELIKAGINIYFYQGMTHAKVFMIDDVLTSVGSLNLEELSLKFQNELNLAIVDPSKEFAGILKEKLFLPDIRNHCRKV